LGWRTWLRNSGHKGIANPVAKTEDGKPIRKGGDRDGGVPPILQMRSCFTKIKLFEG
jgi:hypothetical protein